MSAFPNCQLNTTAPGQHSQIANSTQQRQVSTLKLPTQHNSASRHSEIANSTLLFLPNCQVHFTPVDCPNELQAAHKLKFFPKA